MSTSAQQLQTAVLIITYKRLDTTKKIFAEVKKAKPERLYISSNCGKDAEEVKQVTTVRAYLESNIDWNCKVYSLFRTEHVSAKLSISGAIDWFFENEEMGIILEDDCLPNPSFFTFCEELLEYYGSDERVGMISGDNFQSNQLRGDASYYFTRYAHIWGWATWRRAWRTYDLSMKNWVEFEANNYLSDIVNSKGELRYWVKVFDLVANGKIDTWDYQWLLTLWSHNMLCIVPNVNLISNIGFGIDAVNTTEESIYSEMDTKTMMFPLVHPRIMRANKIADIYTSKNWFPGPVSRKVAGKIAKTIKLVRSRMAAQKL